MKTLPIKWIQPSELPTSAEQAETSLQLLPANSVVDLLHRLPAGKARVKNARLQNFSIFAPAAASVQLAGCFTKWQEQPINLQKGDDGMWRTTVRLERGTYYYRFLVDGAWRDDPDCPLVVPNPFGCLNAVRQVN